MPLSRFPFDTPSIQVPSEYRTPRLSAVSPVFVYSGTRYVSTLVCFLHTLQYCVSFVIVAFTSSSLVRLFYDNQLSAGSTYSLDCAAKTDTGSVPAIITSASSIEITDFIEKCLVFIKLKSPFQNIFLSVYQKSRHNLRRLPIACIFDFQN